MIEVTLCAGYGRCARGTGRQPHTSTLIPPEGPEPWTRDPPSVPPVPGGAPG